MKSNTLYLIDICPSKLTAQTTSQNARFKQLSGICNLKVLYRPTHSVRSEDSFISPFFPVIMTLSSDYSCVTVFL